MKKLDPTQKTVYNFSEKNMANGVSVIGDISTLEKYLSPVSSKPAFFSDGTNFLPADGYKAIVAEKEGGSELLSVMRKSYKLVPNSDVILPVLDQLSRLDSKWNVDPSHSFISPTRMRIQLTFPELRFFDGQSDVAMSLFVHNSYDATERVRMIWGAIRRICSNGMIFGQVFARSDMKHTVNFQIEDISASIEETFEMIPTIKERIDLLATKEFSLTDEVRNSIENNFGKRAIGFIDQEKPDISTEWAVLNALTYYVSHYIHLKQRHIYQARISDMFNL